MQMSESIRSEGGRIRDPLVAEFRRIAEEQIGALDRMLVHQREAHAILDRIDQILDRMGDPPTR